MNHIGLGAWFFLVFILGLTACSNEPYKDQSDRNTTDTIMQPEQKYDYKPPTYYGTFIKPGELEPAVDFWRKTYSLWHRSEVAVHDDRYLDVIYEVFVLPGNVGEGLTSEC